MMKTLFLILLPVFLFGQNTWSLYNSESPQFSVLLPKEPIETEKLIQTDIGETEIKTIYFSSDIDSTENSLYLINYYEIDQIIFFGDSALTKKEYLKHAIEGIAKSLEASVLYANYSDFNECKTVIYRLDIDTDKKVMKGKLVLSGNYFYSLQVFTTKQYSLNRNMDKFIDSFNFEKCN